MWQWQKWIGQKWLKMVRNDSKTGRLDFWKKIKSLGLSGIGVKRKFLWPTDIRLFRKKTKQGRLRTYFFENPLEFFFFFLYPWKFQTKQSSTPGNSTKLRQIPWKFQGQKPRPLEISYVIFFDTPWNSIFWTSPYPHLFVLFWNSPFCENYILHAWKKCGS